MQQTEKYKFNIIDPSDAFGPEKLNENAQKLEDALIAHEGTVSAALSQHKAETDAALGAKADKTTLDALTKTVTANKTAADTTIAAVEKGANLVHLAGPVNNGNTSAAITVSLSGIDMSKYRALLVFVRNPAETTLKAGGMSVPLVSGSAVAWIFQAGNVDVMHVSTIQANVGYSGNFGYNSIVSSAWKSISKITIDYAVFADVYGVKA